MQTTGVNTLSEQNKALARQFVEHMGAQNIEAAIALLGDAWVDHAVGPGIPLGIEGAKAFFAIIWAAFPELQVTIEDMIAEGDKVVTCLRVAGVNRGPLLGMPATGKHATWSVTAIYRVVDGKLVEHWANCDDLGMMQQLGLIPPPKAQ